MMHQRGLLLAQSCWHILSPNLPISPTVYILFILCYLLLCFYQTIKFAIWATKRLRLTVVVQGTTRKKLLKQKIFLGISCFVFFLKSHISMSIILHCYTIIIEKVRFTQIKMLFFMNYCFLGNIAFNNFF